MRRLAALLLAATAAVAGCGRTTCEVGDLVVYWTFTGSDGVARGCADAGVATVRIFVDGQPPAGPGGQADFNCDPFNTGVEGITLRSFFVGQPSQLQLEGYDAAGQLVYLDQRNVTARGCGGTRVDVALASTAADLTVNYTFAQGCRVPTEGSTAPTTFIWYRLLDSGGNVVSAADVTQNQTAIPCSDTARTFVIPQLPFGQYTLRGHRGGAAAGGRHDLLRLPVQLRVHHREPPAGGGNVHGAAPGGPAGRRRHRLLLTPSSVWPAIRGLVIWRPRRLPRGCVLSWRPAPSRARLQGAGLGGRAARRRAWG